MRDRLLLLHMDLDSGATVEFSVHDGFLPDPVVRRARRELARSYDDPGQVSQATVRARQRVQEELEVHSNTVVEALLSAAGVLTHEVQLIAREAVHWPGRVTASSRAYRPFLLFRGQGRSYWLRVSLDHRLVVELVQTYLRLTRGQSQYSWPGRLRSIAEHWDQVTGRWVSSEVPVLLVDQSHWDRLLELGSGLLGATSALLNELTGADRALLAQGEERLARLVLAPCPPLAVTLTGGVQLLPPCPACACREFQDGERLLQHAVSPGHLASVTGLDEERVLALVQQFDFAREEGQWSSRSQ